MRLSKLYLPTLKQVSTDSEYSSQEHLYRAGMIKKLYHGGFSLLPFGNKVYKEWENNLEKNLEEYYINEIHLPSVLSHEGLKQDRYRLEDDTFSVNEDRNLALGIDRDELVVNQVKGTLTSYKKIPITLVSKVSDAKKSKELKESLVGSLEQRYHEFYIFAPDKEKMVEITEDITRNFEKMIKMDLSLVSGQNSKKQRFKTKSLYINLENGEENYVVCRKCEIASEFSAIKPYAKSKEQEYKEKEKIYTPNVKTIEELEEFLKIEGYRFVKSLIYKADDEYIMVEIPGDQELDEAKLSAYLQVPKSKLELAEMEMVKEITGAEVGFAGPLNLNKEVRTLVDKSVTEMYNFVVGANETDYHVKNVNYKKDYEAELVEDLLEVTSNSRCERCGEKFDIQRGVKVLEIREYEDKLGESLDLNYLDENGKKKAMYYSVIRVYNDSLIQGVLEKAKLEDTFVMPKILAPYDLSLVLVNPKAEEQSLLAESIYSELQNLGMRVLFDDRKERAGAKFKDAELMGMPYRLTVGRGAKDGVVEWIDSYKGIKEEISYEKALNLIRSLDRA